MTVKKFIVTFEVENGECAVEACDIFDALRDNYTELVDIRVSEITDLRMDAGAPIVTVARAS